MVLLGKWFSDQSESAVCVQISDYLQNVLTAAARIILRKRKFDRLMADLLDQLHWLPFSSVLSKRCLHYTRLQVCPWQYQPTSLRWSHRHQFCILHHSVIRRHLRFATHGDLAVPRSTRSRTTRYERSLAVSGSTLWNTLPPTMRYRSLTLSK